MSKFATAHPTAGDENVDPTEEAWETTSSMAWIISESMISALMTSARINSWLTRTTFWATSWEMLMNYFGDIADLGEEVIKT